MVIFALAVRCGAGGQIKWFVKDIVRRIPLLGWAGQFAECLFLKRSLANDGDNIAERVRSFVETDTPTWVTMFPEGKSSGCLSFVCCLTFVHCQCYFDPPDARCCFV